MSTSLAATQRIGASEGSKWGRQSVPVKVSEELATVNSHCTCLECGLEFSVQRKGALYLCERCAASDL